MAALMTLRNFAMAGASGSFLLAGAVITHFEGRNLMAYFDPVGIPTICDGVTAGVKIGMTATHEECDNKLLAEMNVAAAAVDRLVSVPLPDTRRAALISFVYNVGSGAFERSTLRRKLNAGDPNACDELLRWVYAGGKKLRGLERRRKAEHYLCSQ